MYSVPTETLASSRARWLAELADKLDRALQLLLKLDLQLEMKPEALDLYVRIEAALLEVQSLRLSRSTIARKDNGPEWIGFTPWSPK